MVEELRLLPYTPAGVTSGNYGQEVVGCDGGDGGGGGGGRTLPRAITTSHTKKMCTPVVARSVCKVR